MPSQLSGAELIASTQSRHLVFDTETTGLGADHRIVELGIVEIINRKLTGRVFHKYINPERSVDPDAERVHGLSSRFLSDQPKFRDVVDELLAFLGKPGGSLLVAHNATFDVNKLNAEFQRLGLPFRINESFEIIDTMKESRKLWPGQRATLDAMCARLGVSLSEREVNGLHGALADSNILARAFLAMTAGQVHFGYSLGPQAGAATGRRVDRAHIGRLKVVAATPAEESAHARLCDAIEKSSGGYCGFRGKWSGPERAEPARLADTAPVSGTGTVPPRAISSSSAAPVPFAEHPVLNSMEDPATGHRTVVAGPRGMDFSPSI